MQNVSVPLSSLNNTPVVRRRRYEADDIALSLYDMPLKARRSVRKLYRHLVELTYLLRPWLDNPEYPTAMAETRLRIFVRTARWSDILATLQDVTPNDSLAHDQRVLRVIHDLRGGALSSLSIYLQLADSGDLHAQDIPHLVLLANDHAKMLRTTIVDLDRVRYTRDEIFAPQSIECIVNAWRNVHYFIASGASAQVYCESQVSGYIADSVIELAALERVIYNLVNNAVNHSVDKQVHVKIKYTDETRQLVTFTVSNAIDEHHARILDAMTCNSAQSLITHALSTTDSGLGLGICADIVAHVLNSEVMDIVNQRLFEVQWSPAQFTVSFVWPRVE